MTHIVGVCVPPTRASFGEHPSHRRHRHGHRVAARLRSGRGVAAADRGSARASAACLTRWWATCRRRSPASSPIAPRIRPRDSTPTASCRPKDQRKMDRFIPLALAAAQEALAAGALAARRSGRARADRDDHRLGHRRVPRDRGCGAHHRHARPATPLAVHGAVVPHQSRGGTCVDPARLQGPDWRTGDRVRGGRAGDWRCGAADPGGRSRCRALRRHGIGDSPRQPRQLCRGSRALDRLQRHARARVAAVRQRPRRLCDGRRRRHARARDAGARACARRGAARRADRLRDQRRRVSPDRRSRRRERRGARDDRRAGAGAACHRTRFST